VVFYARKLTRFFAPALHKPHKVTVIGVVRQKFLQLLLR
jgi:hypothetical protein